MFGHKNTHRDATSSNSHIPRPDIRHQGEGHGQQRFGAGAQHPSHESHHDERGEGARGGGVQLQQQQHSQQQQQSSFPSQQGPDLGLLDLDSDDGFGGGNVDNNDGRPAFSGSGRWSLGDGDGNAMDGTMDGMDGSAVLSPLVQGGEPGINAFDNPNLAMTPMNLFR